jgi:diadenosine tetraphosphate (Ap4A) HIT family hydrolase
MEEISIMAETLAEVFQPVKVNYALLGNQLPHIHWHLIPRLVGDPAIKDPVWSVPHEPRRLANGLLQERVDRIAAAVALRWG